MFIRDTPSRKIFRLANALFLLLIACVMVLPFVMVLASSFATESEAYQRPLMLFPLNPTLECYTYLFSSSTIFTSIYISIVVTGVGTAVNIVMTVLMAYPLAHKNLHGRSFLLNMVIFPMLFCSGMIPQFILVKELGLLNSLWSLILPTAISSYNLLVVKSFFQELPDELEDAARIDGANELITLLRIILPLSLPVLATFTLFYAVDHWNSYFTCLLYINDAEKWTVQLVLRQLIILSSGANVGSDSAGEMSRMSLPSAGLRNAAIIVATLPIAIVYPFLQKYFTKGMLLGSVKG